MSTSQSEGSILAERYVQMLISHNPDAVDGFVALDYINHNAFVGTDAKAIGPSGQVSSRRFRTLWEQWRT